MPHYDQPSEQVIALIKSTIKEFHPELDEAQVTVDAIMAYNDKGFAVKAGGYPALACIKANSLANRIKGLADALITIDGDSYDSMSEAQQRGLIDHELTHLNIKRDKEQNIVTDDAGRPKIKMKKHDYQMGWFREIAIRHGENSPEVYQAKLLWRNDGKTFFPQV